MAKAKQVCLIIFKQYGTDGDKKFVTPIVGRKAAGEAMATLLEEAQKNGHYTSPIHYKSWGRYKGYHRLAVDSFHASHANGTESSVELRIVEEGKAVAV
jgi:hypothetical protein